MKVRKRFATSYVIVQLKKVTSIPFLEIVAVLVHSSFDKNKKTRLVRALVESGESEI